MNRQSKITVARTSYDKTACQIGLVHLGFGAFHRAHQAVFFDDYMDNSGDLAWGIAAVNLRQQDSAEFERLAQNQDGYLLKTTTPSGISAFRMVRPHVHFADWSKEPIGATNLLAKPSVKALSMTVTESGYYLNDDWTLNVNDPLIASEINGTARQSIYAYLAGALAQRIAQCDAPITLLCCDNIRANGDMLKHSLTTYLRLTGHSDIADWLNQNAVFPNSMVDRITPRSTDALRQEIQAIAPDFADGAIHGESFIQWVLQHEFANDFPALNKVGVELVADVDPYEEAKIRILNGGHTALCYLGALAGLQTFDQVMVNPELRQHFDRIQTDNILPGLTADLPFEKGAYLELIAQRFSNPAIADDLERICMDGWSKFPIFIRPTIESCLQQGISPTGCYDSIASWYVYARRFCAGQTHIPYIEPYWDRLEPLLHSGQEHAFASESALWSDLPQKHDAFVPALIAAIKRTEQTWPI